MALQVGEAAKKFFILVESPIRPLAPLPRLGGQKNGYKFKNNNNIKKS